MRYAIISDVHANEAALRAVLTDAADAHAEKIVCLGDVLGYGPDPVQALELVYRRAHVCLAGNHDDAVCGRFPVDDFTDFAAQAVARHRAALTRKAKDWLRGLPHVCEFPAPEGGAGEGAFACAHGEFLRPERFDYLLDAADALPSWRTRTEQLLFVGHTHKPGIFVLGESGVPHALSPADFTLEPGKRYVVNVGSVGYPRSGACRTFYCIYDDCSRTVFFRSLPFDLEAYSEKMHGQGLDEAPWMKARGAERRGGEVREAADFAKRRLPAQRPLEITAEKESAGPSYRKYTVLAVAAALVVLFAAAWWMRRGGGDEAPELAAAAAATTAVQAEQKSELPPQPFSGEKYLGDGWSALFERPGEQGAEPLKGTPPGFRVMSEKSGTVRLLKSIDVSGGDRAIHWSVALLSKHVNTFSFKVRIIFLGTNGAVLDKKIEHSGKYQAMKHKPVDVPPGAARAEMTIDCVCEGVHDVALPYFGTTPPPKASAAPQEEASPPPAKKPPAPKPSPRRKPSRRRKR